MNYASVARVLSLLMLIVAGTAVLGAGIAGAAGEGAQVLSLGVTAMGIGVAAASVLLLTPSPKRRARPSDGLAVVILWWLLTPLATAMPFVFGVANSSVITAVHEAAACLTTTGHSVIRVDTEGWPTSLIFWRGALHVLGAFAVVVTAAGVFAAVNLGGPGVHKTVLFTLPETSFFDAVPRILVPVGLMFGVGILFIFGVLIVLGVDPGRALGDAVSVITTGLVHPDALERAPGSSGVAVALGTGLFLGSLGLAFWLPFRRFAWAGIVQDPEIAMFGIFALLFTGFAVLAGVAAGDALGWSISTLSTSGIPLGSPQAAQSIPLTVYVMPCLIGGSALAAAGGIKLARVVVLGQRAGQEFQQLGYRRSVVSFRFRDRELDERSVIGVWVYFVAYVLAVFLFLIGFSFMGLGFDDSIRLSIGALTSSGALIAGADGNLGLGSEILLIAAMLLGRLEILTLLPALSLSFWRG
ncbi:MAG: potassium transporter TrkG [Hyphomonas sp.]|uniref:potassium transporter TrkG n=1 Tax=Hyphomonas sp. TaxID=87 RepID=UPI0034A0388A